MTAVARPMAAWCGAALAAAILCALSGPPAGAQGTDGSNPYNDELERMTPEARASRLAGYVGFDCIGSRPFLMGVTKTGKAKGYAYWSIQCAGAKAYMIQIAPDGEAASVDCAAFKQAGQGRECFKTF